MNFSSLVPHIKERLTLHHQLYSMQCKELAWEENLCYALKKAGFGSDWRPDSNHKSGVDQTTDIGVRIGNKSGAVHDDVVTINGSRSTKHKTLEEKLEFLRVKKEDYIFCLGCEKKEWDRGLKIYYFIVIDSNKINYHDQQWSETIGRTGRYKDKVNGWEMTNENYSAKISKSMSDQLWTTIKLDMCEEIHDIVIG